ncbi:DUF6232 family protein [Spirilliplanes yamanashiensis]|uniref:Transmembrane protein n=1 Tax=Spirilliplanes yamanashiensis TaxID=42233 RepID=A0A8J3Y433_9ACTN|nr:DUF6232 family protein [Spirilliplanes yamanashiensis]MDP9819843.1 hypothetical protein [Spirilliplanes yamanashiensis]GIJ01338.1 hypothetical protein Sya03_06900 [Spirilliplanes yamanashiensis]
MTEFYRDPEVTVTTEAIRVGGRAIPLGLLGRVWHRRGSRSWGALAGRGAIGMTMLLPLVLAALGIAVGVSIDASANTTVLLVGGGILLGLATGPVADLLFERLDRSYTRGSRRLEIWADVRGTPMCLVETDDRLRFGQIYRALQRALDAGAPAGPRAAAPARSKASPRAPR